MVWTIILGKSFFSLDFVTFHDHLRTTHFNINFAIKKFKNMYKWNLSRWHNSPKFEEPGKKFH